MTQAPAQGYPSHHPGDEQLMAYAAGDTGEALGLVIATHLALCPACRHRVGEYEALGGELLATLKDAALSEGSLSQTLARLERAPAEVPPPGQPSAGQVESLPRPLRDYMSRAWADKVAWRRAMPGLRTLKLKADGAKVWMMEIAAGKPIPHHSHTGQEMVLVLSGGYHDGPTAYGPGDVQLSGPETIHEPVADADGPCLCLVLVEGSIRPTSLLGRIVAGLMGY